MSVLRDHKNEEIRILLTTASLAIRNSAQFVFIRANGQTTEEDSKHTHAHTAGSSLWACKHTVTIHRTE